MHVSVRRVCCFAVVLAGCHHGQVAPATTSGATEVRRVDTLRVPTGTIDTMFPPVVRRALAEADERADAAVSRIAFIDVQPDSFVLRAGQVVSPRALIAIQARDSVGTVIPQFAPWLSIEDHAIADFGPRGLMGLRPGTTHLFVRPFSRNPGIRVPPVQALVRVIVVAVPN